MTGRLIAWPQYVAERPALAGCPASGLVGVLVEWDAGGEVVRIAGLLASGREVTLVDLLSEEPRPILSAAEVDALVRAAVLALGAEASA